MGREKRRGIKRKIRRCFLRGERPIRKHQRNGGHFVVEKGTGELTTRQSYLGSPAFQEKKSRRQESGGRVQRRLRKVTEGLIEREVFVRRGDPMKREQS